MLDGETFLLRSVRNFLREKLTLSDTQCDCEPDEMVPAIAGDTYVAVIPNGFQPGPRHDTSGGVFDILHSVRVVVYQRIGNVPRDRRRSVYLDRLTGLNQLIAKIITQIDFSIDVMAVANTYLRTDFPTAQLFIEPLRLAQVDSKPRTVSNDEYAAAIGGGGGSSQFVALARGVTFGRCRRIQGRS